MLATITIAPNAVLVSATDANATGDRYAARHAELAAAAGVAFARLRTSGGIDWNAPRPRAARTRVRS